MHKNKLDILNIQHQKLKDEVANIMQNDGLTCEYRLEIIAPYIKEICSIENKIGKLKNHESKRNRKRKYLTAHDCVRAVRLYKNIQSYKMLSQLFGVCDIYKTLSTKTFKEICKNNSETTELKPEDIIIPSVQLKMSPENKQSISDVQYKSLELLGECVCEALKREQIFTLQTRKKRIKEFANILYKCTLDQIMIRRVYFTFKLRFSTTNEEERYSLPTAVDPYDILCYCLKKFEMKKQNKETKCNNFNGTSLVKSDNKTQLTSLSDVKKLLKPIRNFANMCENKIGLRYISMLDKHISKLQK